MTKFLLIRHASNSYVGKALAGHIAGVHIDETGRRQAEDLAARLMTVPVAAIYSSPLERAVETAEPLARAKGMPIEPRDRLTELGLGQWQGKTFEELGPSRQWQRFNTFRSGTRSPGGELMLEVQARIVDELEELRERHGTGSIVAIFSHSDVIKSAIAHYAGVPLDLFHRFEIAPVSVSTLGLSDRGPLILGVNDTGMLPPV